MHLPLLLLLALASVVPAAPAPAELRDLKITMRFTYGRAPAFTTTQYLKGDRSRFERDILGHPRVTINQCDQRQVLQLDPEARQYTSYQLNEQGLPAGSQPSAQAPPQPEPSEGTLVMNVETTDTGERKKLFGYTARHVIEKRTFVSGPDPLTRVQEIVLDGWYIDLDVNIGCGPRPKGAKIEIRRKGARETGFPVSLMDKNTMYGADGKPLTSKSANEVVELSTAPLDSALFDVPEGFQKVNRLPDYIAASARPSPPPGPWDTIKRYWASLFR
jgi:hypothetical protein